MSRIFRVEGGEPYSPPKFPRKTKRKNFSISLELSNRLEAHMESERRQTLTDLIVAILVEWLEGRTENEKVL